MAVCNEVTFAYAITFGEVAAELSHSTFSMGCITPISSHGGV